jgi:flagellar biosynthesis regulator FlaF
VVKQLALRMDSTVEENKEREAQLVTKELKLMGAAKM